MSGAIAAQVAQAQDIERALVQRGFDLDVEDELVAQVPFREDELAALTATAPETDFAQIARRGACALNRQLAGIALVHTRRLDREAFELARSALSSGRPRFASEAAIALTRWFVRGAPLVRWDRELVAEAARPLLVHPELAPYAAIAMELDDRELLQRGLAHADPDLRFACALALGHEEALDRVLDSTDEQAIEAATRVLGVAGSKLLYRRLADSGDDLKLELIAALRHPAEPAAIDALLAGCSGARHDVATAAAGFLVNADVPRDRRASVAKLLARPDVAIEHALAALDHAKDDASPFAEAVTAQLERLDRDQLAALLDSHHRWSLQKWIVHATTPREHAVLDAMLGDPRIAEIALACAANADAADILIAWWDRRYTESAQRFGHTFSHASSRLRERLVAELWRRFKDHPEQRAAIAIACADLRRELHELRRLEPRQGPFGTRDLVRFYRTFCTLDILGAVWLLGDALEEARRERGEAKRDYPQLAALVEEVWGHAVAVAAKRPSTAAQLCALLASHVVAAYRHESDDPHLQHAITAMRERHAALLDAIDAASPIDPSEARASGSIEQLETELRLAREAEDRAAARRPRAPVAAPEPAPAPPQIDPAALDREHLVDGPLATLGEYAAFLKEMSSGCDVPALMARHDLDPMRWAACSQAWMRVFQTRPDLVARLAVLIAAPRS